MADILQRNSTDFSLPMAKTEIPGSDVTSAYNKALNWFQTHQEEIDTALLLIRQYPRLLREECLDGMWNFLISFTNNREENSFTETDKVLRSCSLKVPDSHRSFGSIHEYALPASLRISSSAENLRYGSFDENHYNSQKQRPLDGFIAKPLETHGSFDSLDRLEKIKRQSFSLPLSPLAMKGTPYCSTENVISPLSSPKINRVNPLPKINTDRTSGRNVTLCNLKKTDFVIDDSPQISSPKHDTSCVKSQYSIPDHTQNQRDPKNGTFDNNSEETGEHSPKRLISETRQLDLQNRDIIATTDDTFDLSEMQDVCSDIPGPQNKQDKMSSKKHKRALSRKPTREFNSCFKETSYVIFRPSSSVSKAKTQVIRWPNDRHKIRRESWVSGFDSDSEDSDSINSGLSQTFNLSLGSD